VVEALVYGRNRLVLLKHLLDQGLSKTDIARQLGISRRLVYHWIRTGQLERDVTAPRIRVGRPEKLAPYKAIIEARLAAYPDLSAQRLFAEVRAAGYPGGITRVCDFVAQVRPQPPTDPVVRFETPPGHQGQVDFAEFRFPWGKRFALLVVLGYSRLLWVRFYPRQTMATLMAGLEEAFAYFGGVPQELLFDQLKAVIDDDRRPDGGTLLENPEFLRFAAHWTFRIRACRPYRARTKGKVERPVGYLRTNFVYGRTFLGDGDLDAQCRTWLDTVANQRVHGTTREIPQVRFAREEQAVLHPLAYRPYRVLGASLVPSERPRTAARATGGGPPAVVVERRPLAAYARLGEGV
jgi:transposase